MTNTTTGSLFLNDGGFSENVLNSVCAIYGNGKFAQSGRSMAQKDIDAIPSDVLKQKIAYHGEDNQTNISYWLSDTSVVVYSSLDNSCIICFLI